MLDKPKKWQVFIIALIMCVAGMCFSYTEADASFLCNEGVISDEAVVPEFFELLDYELCGPIVFGNTRIICENRDADYINASKDRSVFVRTDNIFEKLVRFSWIIREDANQNLFSKSSIIGYIHNQDGEK